MTNEEVNAYIGNALQQLFRLTLMNGTGRKVRAANPNHRDDGRARNCAFTPHVKFVHLQRPDYTVRKKANKDKDRKVTWVYKVTMV